MSHGLRVVVRVLHAVACKAMERRREVVNSVRASFFLPPSSHPLPPASFEPRERAGLKVPETTSRIRRNADHCHPYLDSQECESKGQLQTSEFLRIQLQPSHRSPKNELHHL